MRLMRKLSDTEILELVAKNPPLTTGANIINFVRDLFMKATIRFGDSPVTPKD